MEDTKNKGGSPTLEEQANNRHVKQAARLQKRLANDLTKVGDLASWILDDMHRCNDPANKGKTELVLQPNPLYDPDDKECKEPEYIEVEQPIYQPYKYKIATIQKTLEFYVNNNGKQVDKITKARASSMSKADEILAISKSSNPVKSVSHDVDDYMDGAPTIQTRPLDS